MSIFKYDCKPEGEKVRIIFLWILDFSFKIKTILGREIRNLGCSSKFFICTTNLHAMSCLQLLRGKSFRKYDNWDLRQTGSGGSVEEQIRGDCDDEDGCGGSGSKEVKRVLKITECKSMIPFHTFKE